MACVLCGGEVQPDHKTMFVAPAVPLPDLDNSSGRDFVVFHLDCYARWPRRPAFAAAVIDHWRREKDENPYWVELADEPQYLLHANPNPPVVETAVVLAPSGRDVRVKIRDWEKWLAGGPATDGLADFEIEALSAAMADLARRFPTRSHVMHAAWNARSSSRRRP